MEFSGLAEFLDTPVKRYSTGMYARLGFSVAAHVDSDILLVDEVLSVGDYLFQKRCMERMKKILDRGAAIVFVSHNLDAVATFCSRVILLDHGRIVKEGDPQAVISAYTDLERAETRDAQDKEAFVSGLLMRDRNGPKTRFQAGDEVWLDIEVTANRPCERLSLAVYLKNDRNIESFYTSSVRLGLLPLTLDAGDTMTFTFRLKLHLAGGEFQIGAQLYRYGFKIARAETDDPVDWHIYDEIFPLGRLFVNSPTDVGGVANLYPEIEVRTTVAKDRDDRLLQPAFVPRFTYGLLARIIL